MLSFTNILINVPITLIALTAHEFAHGWVSRKQGDPTPEYEGRLTLNPLAHLDPMGTILMILTGFGWAKPVGVNPMYYKDRKKGMALTALAGPMANFILAFIAIILMAVFELFAIGFSINSNVYDTVTWIFYIFAYRNLCFMVFNLIPIPPLDGSKVLGMFIPNSTYYKILRYEQYAIILLMLMSLSGMFDRIIGNGVGLVMYFIIKTVSTIFTPIISIFF